MPKTGDLQKGDENPHAPSFLATRFGHWFLEKLNSFHAPEGTRNFVLRIYTQETAEPRKFSPQNRWITFDLVPAQVVTKQPLGVVPENVLHLGIAQPLSPAGPLQRAEVFQADQGRLDVA